MIEDNVIHDNWTTGQTEEEGFEGEGGGIWLYRCDDATVRGNTISGNQATKGGGIYVRESTVRIEQNLFVANYDSSHYETNPSLGRGAGIFADIATVGEIEHNTIVGNLSALEGAAIYVVGPTGGGLRIDNNIIVQNVGGGGIIYSENGCALFACNDIWGNSEPQFGGLCSDPTGTDGNISMDPLFCSPDSGSFRLLPDSPCTEENSPASCGLIGAFQVGCNPVDVFEPVAGMTTHLGLLAWPNPSSGGVTLSIRGEIEGVSVVDIAQISGRVIRQLLLPEGASRLRWDGLLRNGARAPAGVYYVRVHSGGSVATGRVVLAR